MTVTYLLNDLHLLSLPLVNDASSLTNTINNCDELIFTIYIWRFIDFLIQNFDERWLLEGWHSRTLSQSMEKWFWFRGPRLVGLFDYCARLSPLVWSAVEIGSKVWHYSVCYVIQMTFVRYPNLKIFFDKTLTKFRSHVEKRLTVLTYQLSRFWDEQISPE